MERRTHMRREYTIGTVRGMDIGDTQMIHQKLEYLNEEKHFAGFDKFMMGKLLPEEERKVLLEDECTQEQVDALRKKAYQCFYRQVKTRDVAARGTIRAWFGMDRKIKPKRIHIYKIAFALSLTPEELEEYLVQGILEPGVQINDYQEILYLYCLEHSLSWEECQDMIMVFEQYVNKETTIEQHTHTHLLWEMYQKNCKKGPDEFLLWMCENAGFFKGYSRVALHHFEKNKAQILDCIREEAAEALERCLQAEDYYIWLNQNQIKELPENREKNIERFVRNTARISSKEPLSDDAKDEIRELKWIVYSSKERTTDLLAELYANALKEERGENETKKRILFWEREKFFLPESIYFMTDKYVSQLVGVAAQKEKQIRLSQILGSLQSLEADSECPESVWEILEQYGISCKEKKNEELKKVLEKQLMHQNQRCHLVQREDLLPLIHYLSQRSYRGLMNRSGCGYNRQDAVNMFIEQANSIMADCRMAFISPQYELDYFLLLCYGEKEMYSLSDVLGEAWCGE